MSKFLVFLFITYLGCYCNASNNYNEAAQKAGEAAYVQTGLNKIVDNNVKYLQERLPANVKSTLDVIVPLVDVVIKQRVELKYEF